MTNKELLLEIKDEISKRLKNHQSLAQTGYSPQERQVFKMRMDETEKIIRLFIDTRLQAIERKEAPKQMKKAKEESEKKAAAAAKDAAEKRTKQKEEARKKHEKMQEFAKKDNG